MGTSRFAVPVLRQLVQAGHEIAAVVTQPDRPSGRGRGVHISPVKELAIELGLPVYQPENIRAEEAVQQVRSYTPLDAIVVAAFGQIIPRPILDIPRLGCINVHASLLPKYRGAAPIQYAIMSGENVTGVTTMLMDAGLDTGDILLKKKVSIRQDETAGELEDELSKVGAELLIETLDKLEKGEIAPKHQDDSKATIVRSIKREQGEIDWSKSAGEIVNLVRAFNPRPGAYTYFDNLQVKIWEAKIGTSIPGGKTPGEIVEITVDNVVVAAGEGSVILVELQPENRKRMSAGEFARGARIKPGAKFGV